MKTIFIALLVAVATMATFAQQQSPTPAARISGRVLTIDNNIPIAGATVMLRRTDSAAQPTSVASGRGGGTAVKTDDLGAFVAEGLEPGVYLIIATAPGYFPPDATPNRRDGFGKVFTLTTSQQLANVDFRLGKAGVFAGVVLDEKGEVVPGVRMSIMQPMMAAGARRLMPLGTGTSTDATGRFQFADLAPGDYFVVAMGSPFGVDNGSMLTPIKDATRPGFSPTYYPSTTSAGSAQPISIQPGSNINDIRISLWTSAMFDVRGRIVDEAGAPVTAGAVQLLQLQGDDVRVVIPANVPVGKDGSFAIAKVPIGSYVLQARSATGFGALPIQVIDDRQVEHKVTTLAPRTIKGKFVFEGVAPDATAGFRLNVQPTDFVHGPVGGLRAADVVVHDDWTFELPGVMHTGVLRGAGSQGWIAKRVLIDGRDVTDIPFDYRQRDLNNVEVVFSNRWASIEVQVVDAKDVPVPGATVIVFAQNQQKLKYPSRYIATGSCDQRGVFRASGLPAESYLVVAVPAGRVMAGEVDPAFLDLVRTRASSVALAETQKATLKLSVINPK